MKTVVLAAALVLCGCGSGEAEKPGRATRSPAATNQEPSPVPPIKRSAQERQVAREAERYVTGLSTGDYGAVCETRSPPERKELARLAGSCERSFELLVKNKPAIPELLKGAEVAEVRIRRDKAGADLRQRGQTKPATTIGAVRIRGRWYLQDLPDRLIP